MANKQPDPAFQTNESSPPPTFGQEQARVQQQEHAEVEAKMAAKRAEYAAQSKVNKGYNPGAASHDGIKATYTSYPDSLKPPTKKSGKKGK